MKSYISFRLKEGENWDVDDVIVDLKILIPELILTSHDYHETQRQFDIIISKTREKCRGEGFPPDFLNNLIDEVNEREARTGLCKGFEIVCDNSLCRGTVNERGGIKIIGQFSLKDKWARKLIAHLKKMSDKGDLEVWSEKKFMWGEKIKKLFTMGGRG